MSQKSVKKNYVYNVCYQVFNLLPPLITTPYISRVLGAGGVGIASYIQSIVSYFSLFAAMGMTTFGQREMSYAQRDREQRTTVFFEIKILEFLTTMLALIGYILFSMNQKQSNLYLVFIFSILSVFADVTWLFYGMEEFGKIVFRNALFKIINIVYIFLFIKKEDDLIWYLFGLSFFTFLSNVSLWVYLPKWIDIPKWKKLQPFRHIGVIISLFVPTIATQIYTVLDKTMIGVITQNASENGYYEQAFKMSKILLSIVTSLGTVMVPRIGHLFQIGDTQNIEKLMYRSYRFVWFLGIPFCFGLFACADNFVPWFFGDGYDKVVLLLRIFSLLIIAIGISNVTGTQYLIPTKSQKKYTISVLAGALTNFCMNLILIPLWASIGAAIASIIAEFVVTTIQLIFVRKELKFIKILKEGMLYYFAGTIMLLVLLVLSSFFKATLIYTIILVLIGASIYIVILILAKDKFLLSNVNSVLNKVKKKKTYNDKKLNI